MPSHRPMKTYSKKTRLPLNNSTKSVDAINALFAQNLTKRLKCRRKAKLKIKELPPRKEEYVTDDSLKVDPNDTFDKILKGKVYNKVKTTNFLKINSTESDSSKSKTHVSVTFQSPIMTRRRKKSSVAIAEVSEASASLGKSSTLDKPVTSSLSIEKENKGHNFSSLSYIKLPKITENEVVNNNIFSDTFRERQAIHSSTPCVTAPVKKLVADQISPITKSDSSNSSKLIEKSYDHIREWDEKYPSSDGDTPKRNLVQGRRRNLSDTSLEDWKLYCEPKVYLRCSDNIDKFLGFSEEEQSSSSKESSRLQIWLSRLSVDNQKKKSLPKLKYNPRNGSRNSSKITPRNSKDTTHKLLKNVGRKSKKKVSSNRGSSLRKSESNKRTRMNPQASESRDESSSYRSERNQSKSRKESRARGSEQSENNKQKLKKIPQNLDKSESSVGKSTKIPQISPMRTRRGTRKESLEPKVETSVRALQESEGFTRRSVRTLQKKKLLSSPQKPLGKHLEMSLQMTPKKTPKSQSPRYITLRRRQVVYPVKTSKKPDISAGRKSKIKKPQCVNVTEDILSEKEVSYCNSASFDFSSRSKICDSTEQLKQDKEISIPKKNKSITVDLQKFDNFVHSFYIGTSGDSILDTSQEKKAPTVSIISLSDDSMPLPTPPLFIKPHEIKAELASTSGGSLNKTQGSRSSLDFLISPRRSSVSNQTPMLATEGSKIVILSNITLGSINQSTNDVIKSVYHDHSYSNSPAPKIHSTPVTHAGPRMSSAPSSTPVNPNKKSSILNTTPRCFLKDAVMPESPEKESSGLSDIIESSIVLDQDKNNKIANERKTRKLVRESIKLEPGKSYRRTLCRWRKSLVVVDARNSQLCQKDCTCLKCLFRRKPNPDYSMRSPHVVPISRKSLNKSFLESFTRGYVQREEDFIDHLDDSVKNLSLNSRNSILRENQTVVTAKEIVLRRCGQTEVLPFEECYPRSALQHCRKIGEGLYGEVFLYRNQNGGTSVMKVIPIEGDLIVNGERQKKCEEILSEIVIAMEVSNLRNNKKNITTGFSEVHKIKWTKGSYPDRLIDLWDLYDETKVSENDSPLMFPSNQNYIVLELANGGQDLESYVFNNAEQAFSMFKQTACALAVAENQLKFEHRDLHWGNILLNNADKTKILKYRLDGKEIQVETAGVEVSLIDFTLSRIELDGFAIFNDLSRDDELFAAKGDYQFDIYRLMQKANDNEWKHFEPYTNVLWLHYILDKCATALRYKNPRTKIHKEYLGRLKKLKNEILSFNSAVDFVNEKFV